MYRTITSKGIIAGSLYKILFIGHAFSLGLFVLIMGALSLFGYETVQVDGVPVTGIMGLLSSVLAAAILALLLSFLNWIVILIGNWVFTRFSTYEIVINEIENPRPPASPQEGVLEK